jgi:hypothetical protein
MSSSRGVLLALVVLLAGAPGCFTSRQALHPPAPVRQAGIRPPDAGLAARFPAPNAASPPRPTSRDEAVRRAVAAAAGLVGAREIVSGGVRYGDDCAALVRAALAAAGSPAPPGQGDVDGLHALARARGALRRGRPAPGDLVFLADRPGGAPEHVGVVQSVGMDGTALVLHRADGGVARLRVNGARPWTLRGEDGRAVNDAVIVGAGRIPAGRLLVGYANVTWPPSR